MQLKKMSKRHIAISLLGTAMLLQASYYNCAFAATNITGVTQNQDTGAWDIRPEAFKGDVGFRKFEQFVLEHGDIANFIFQYMKEKAEVSGSDVLHRFDYNDIQKFVALVDGQVDIKGIVNALTAQNGALKTDGHLIFVTPNGMVVGSSGVLNVGSLSVLTPTQDSYNLLKNGVPTAKQSDQYVNQPLAEEATADFDTWRTSHYTRGTGVINISDGGIIARQNVELDGGTIKVGNNGKVFAGVNDSTVFKAKDPQQKGKSFNPTQDAANLFDELVNARTSNANKFAGSNGEIIITSGDHINTDNGSYVVNNAGSNGKITMTNYGANGININGEVRNNSSAGGNVTITNKGGKLDVGSKGLVEQVNGDMTFLNKSTADSLNVADGGNIKNTGKLTMTNEGAKGFNVSGNIENAGTTHLKNTGDAGFNLESVGHITNNKGSDNKLTIENTGAKGAHFKGLTLANDGGSIDIINQNSDVVIGDETSNNYYIDAVGGGDVTFTVTKGNIKNSGVTKTHVRTSNNGNLKMTVTDGAIGEEVGPCAGGVCTGIGPNARDWKKSVNVNIDGKITAESTGEAGKSLINLASADNDMHLNYVKADGRVILLADDINNKGKGNRNILNYADNNAAKPNMEGTGISAVASGSIGTSEKKVTFRQNDVKQIFNGDDATQPHVVDNFNKPSQGVDMLAIKDINVKGLDSEDGKKLDTNVCAMIAREGSVNAEFSGDTYIKEVTAQNNIDIVTRGKNLYIDNLGDVPDYPNDYYGPNNNVIPDKVTLKALDLGSYWSESEAPKYEHAADSTVVVKQGRVEGKSQGRPSTQDVTIVGDNVYAGGYYFNMGKHRGKAENGKFKPSTVTPDGTTQAIDNVNGEEDASIRAKAVRPEDVKAVGGDSANKTTENDNGRNYYYGGSSQGDDPNYGGDDGQPMPDDKKGTEDDDDNLVVPTPEPSTEPTTPAPTTPEPTTPEPTTPEPTTPEPTTPEPTTPEPTTPEPTTPEPTTPEPTTPEPTTPEPTTPEPTTPEPTTPEPTTPEPTTPEPTTPEPTHPGLTSPEPTEPSRDDVDDATWVQRKDISDNVPTIDKRQYMRFDGRYTENPIELLGSGNGGVSEVLDISRGGVSLAHDNSLKVGDVIPVHIKYGDIEINSDVKIVSASDVKAGAEFININAATANKLLYLSLILDGEQAAQNEIQASFGNNLSSAEKF